MFVYFFDRNEKKKKKSRHTFWERLAKKGGFKNFTNFS